MPVGNKRVVSIRLEVDTIEKLKKLAREKSVEENKDICWSDLVRLAIDEALQEHKNVHKQ